MAEGYSLDLSFKKRSILSWSNVSINAFGSLTVPPLGIGLNASLDAGNIGNEGDIRKPGETLKDEPLGGGCGATGLRELLGGGSGGNGAEEAFDAGSTGAPRTREGSSSSSRFRNLCSVSS